MNLRKFLLWVLAALISISAQAASVDQDIEIQMKNIASELRCLVCQNETLADSHAELAIDLKNEIRKMLKNKASKQEIIAFMVQRYGDFVLYRPPLKSTTFLLWFGPLIIGIIAISILMIQLKKRRKNTVPLDLSNDEEEQVGKLLHKGQ